MSVKYASILWNRQKKRYDLAMLILMVIYLATFSAIQVVFHPNITVDSLIIRSTATLSFIMLHIILIIGPLSRIDERFLPLLYNRRHLGVTMFLVAFVHGIFSMNLFHNFGAVNPLLSVFTSNPNYASVSQYPFQTLGFFALLILFLMAATSHDFWLKNLSPKIWKTLHMLVYVAYALIVMHVVLGVLQQETSSVLVGLMVLGMLMIIGFHLWAGVLEGRREAVFSAKESFIKICRVEEIDENCAKVVIVQEENIAIFKYEGKVSAINNVCKHQNGPLGEGKMVDGCITCPWHGYQYLPENGCSPAPFTEKVTTYDVKVEDGYVFVNPNPHPEGTAVEPATI